MPKFVFMNSTGRFLVAYKRAGLLGTEDDFYFTKELNEATAFDSRILRLRIREALEDNLICLPAEVVTTRKVTLLPLSQLPLEAK